ncbi:uncharacterized protein LOC133837565 [Drosophila sulfurigaster albostrigata]|uniref:uncharacterized protein LOC133837565 n=1 Tax=Drosophila sulfurigaster albostrigata TaxID=89887 RepID=UPI002D21BEB1|nr:uncharacterized protein LOC133837565 [Drosophila sulfurigaster albostrigata]
MWMPFALSCLLLAFAVDWTPALKIAPCTNSAYPDCFAYCKYNCQERGRSCLYHCENGCGCDESSMIMRNNGGCYQLMQCLFEEDSAEETSPMPEPEKPKILEKQNVNGDKRLMRFWWPSWIYPTRFPPYVTPI